MYGPERVKWNGTKKFEKFKRWSRQAITKFLLIFFFCFLVYNGTHNTAAHLGLLPAHIGEILGAMLLLSLALKDILPMYLDDIGLMKSTTV